MRLWRLIAATRRSRVAAHLNTAVAAWARDWARHATIGAGDCVPAHEIPGERRDRGGWTAFDMGAQRLYIQTEPQAFSALLARPLPETLFEEHLQRGAARSAVWEDVARDAVADLAARIAGSTLSADTSERAAPPKAFWARGSGALVCTSFAGEALVIATDDALVQQLGGPAAVPLQPPLADLRTAVAGQAVDLSVWIGQADITLGALSTIAPGDVITFNTIVEEGFSVNVNGRATPMLAHPGWDGARIAVALTGRAQPMRDERRVQRGH
jgi:hypothetical protein